MAFTWATARYDWRDLSESPDSVVERSPMERGIPKQRRTNSDVRIEVQLTLHFDTATQAADFEAWFFDTIHAGQDFFDWVHPRTGAALQARVVGGALGPLTYLTQTLGTSRRSLKLEYWRSAW